MGDNGATCRCRDSEGYCRYNPSHVANDAVLLTSAWQEASDDDFCIQWEPGSELDHAVDTRLNP